MSYAQLSLLTGPATDCATLCCAMLPEGRARPLAGSAGLRAAALAGSRQAGLMAARAARRAGPGRAGRKIIAL